LHATHCCWTKTEPVPARTLTSLAPAIAAAPDAELAAVACESVLAATAAYDRRSLERILKRDSARLGRIIATVGSAAPFFVDVLARHPDWLLWLAAENLNEERSATQYREGLAAWLRAAEHGDHGDAVRQYKYRELLRITVRDLLPEIVPMQRVGEVLHELSALADVLLSSCLDAAMDIVARKLGPRRWTLSDGTAHEPRFVVLGLGKLGAGELNYSSDVDLIYLYESPGEPDEEAGLETAPHSDAPSPSTYFLRLAQEFGPRVTKRTAEGFLYRIDLDLRPEGSRGALVFSTASFLDYYEHWAATWERAACMKARPVAGDLALGWRVIRALAPLLYRSSVDYKTIQSIRELKAKVETARAAPGGPFDVKVGHGGIRDVETVAQTLQLLHGGRIPQVRGASTESTLLALADAGVLPKTESGDLLAAYHFLRRTENRLQMVAEQQTQRLPTDERALGRLGRSLGFDSHETFSDTLEEHRRRTEEILARIFPELSRRILDVFLHRASKSLAEPANRQLLETLAIQFARAIEASSAPERALNNLERFVEGVSGRRFYCELLFDRPELVPRLTALFASSEFFSSYLAANPVLIEPIFADPNVLLLSRAELDRDFDDILNDCTASGRDGDTEAYLTALRLFHHRELVNIGLLDLGDKINRADAEGALTDLAEACLDHGLALARKQLDRRGAPPKAAKTGRFLVLGMGKLASRELTYGSDLDVIFLYDVDAELEVDVVEAQEYFVRLAQKLIWALATRTAEGVCYEIDARLRPSGSQGMLVTSLASFERYHQTSAHVWERQALLRARPVAGSEKLGEAFNAVRNEILQRPLPADTEAAIHRIRHRTETELARETVSRHDFKTGRGGIHDIESIVQLLQLRHGNQHPELLEPRPTAAQIEVLYTAGHLDRASFESLRDGWEFLQRLSSRLRIVENRSISDLDEERGDVDALARALGYTPSQRGDGARRALLENYRRHTKAIRQAYERMLLVEDDQEGRSR